MMKNFKYIDILNIIKNKNFELGHDVDISLKSAFNMARLEKENNMKSIYYIRFNSDYYDPISNENKNIIK